MDKEYLAWCMKCQKKVIVKEPRIVGTRNFNATIKTVKGFCPHCGTKVSFFIK